MREFELQSTSLIFVMTDNCNVMTGRKSGFVTKLTEHCANLVGTAGCICHQGNLLMKEGSKVPVAAQIVTFAELLSNFLDNKPKVTSILKQCEDISC